MSKSGGCAFVIYDGQCPFCLACVEAVQVWEATGSLEIVNARELKAFALLAERMDAIYNAHKGMNVGLGDGTYHDVESLKKLALMSTRDGRLKRFDA